MKLNENGRSMVEMLGVLGIMGIISIGGIGIVNKTMTEQKNTQVITDASNFAALAKKLACQFDDGYSSDEYTYYMYQSKAFPSNFEYNEDDDCFEGTNEVQYSIEYSQTRDGSVSEYFDMSLGDLSEELCMRIVSTDWGTPQTSGFLGFVGDDDAVDSYSLNDAVNDCDVNGGNTLTLRYKGCR